VLLLSTIQAALTELTAWLEPWRRAVGASSLLSTILLYLHLAALLVAGGLALAADRALLGIDCWDLAARRRHVADRRATHRVVLRALAVVIASGVVLLLSDLALFCELPTFWVKMGLVVALFGNAAAMRHDEAHCQDDAGWHRLRRRARLSVALWLATLLAGTALAAA
jgi:hypothetical protein